MHLRLVQVVYHRHKKLYAFYNFDFTLRRSKNGFVYCASLMIGLGIDINKRYGMSFEAISLSMFVALDPKMAELLPTLVFAGGDLNANRGYILKRLIKDNNEDHIHVRSFTSRSQNGKYYLVIKKKMVDATQTLLNIKIKFHTDEYVMSRVKPLVETGADLATRDGVILKRAARSGHGGLVRFLLESGNFDKKMIEAALVKSLWYRHKNTTDILYTQLTLVK